MRIERLEVENFRGFEERTFEFGPGMNVFVGDNGAGKTSVIRAARIALSEWLCSIGMFTHEDQARYFEESDVRHEMRYVDELGMNQYDAVDRATVTVDVSGLRYNIPYPSTWKVHRYRDGDFASINSPTEIAHRIADRRTKGEGGNVPLVTYFGVDRFKMEERSPDSLPTWRDGYEGALDRGTDLGAVSRWFRDQRLVQADRGEPSEMYRTISAVMKDLIPGMTDLRYHSSVSGLRATFESGQKVAVRHLSDGFRTSVAMFADLATRIAILNPSLGENALKETPGVVLIDELDLHLHPKWQRRIANDLTRTFPNIQFITTTHSPQIISEIDEGNVYLLREDGETEEVHAYGHDASWILRHVMGSTVHPEEIQELLDNAVSALSDARYEDAQSYVEQARELQERTGAIPADDVAELTAEIGSWKMMSEMEDEDSDS